MLDGIYLEKLDVPASVICTEAFLNQSRTMASTHSFTDYPLVEVFHPIATASPAALQKEAERVLDQVLDLLLISESRTF